MSRVGVRRAELEEAVYEAHLEAIETSAFFASEASPLPSLDAVRAAEPRVALALEDPFFWNSGGAPWHVVKLVTGKMVAYRRTRDPSFPDYALPAMRGMLDMPVRRDAHQWYITERQGGASIATPASASASLGTRGKRTLAGARARRGGAWGKDYATTRDAAASAASVSDIAQTSRSDKRARQIMIEDGDSDSDDSCVDKDDKDDKDASDDSEQDASLLRRKLRRVQAADELAAASGSVGGVAQPIARDTDAEAAQALCILLDENAQSPQSVPGTSRPAPQRRRARGAPTDPHSRTRTTPAASTSSTSSTSVNTVMAAVHTSLAYALGGGAAAPAGSARTGAVQAQARTQALPQIPQLPQVPRSTVVFASSIPPRMAMRQAAESSGGKVAPPPLAARHVQHPVAVATVTDAATVADVAGVAAPARARVSGPQDAAWSAAQAQRVITVMASALAIIAPSQRMAVVAEVMRRVDAGGMKTPLA